VQGFRFVVHEGFSVTRIISDIQKAKGDMLALHFVVSEFADLELFSRFLHNLLALGLFIDEGTGRSARPRPNKRFAIYIELPEILSAESGFSSTTAAWPPIGSNWNAKQHPFLTKLPVLTVATAPSSFISVRDDAPFTLDAKAELVATYWVFATSMNWERERFPLEKRVDLVPTDIAALAALEELFQAYGIGLSKRVRYDFIELLHPRLLYFAKLHALCQRPDYIQFLERMMVSTVYISFFVYLVFERRGYTLCSSS
jgi:hypothetical protein